MQSKEERNWNYLHRIINEIVQKKLAEFFITKWNNKFKTTYGEWDNSVQIRKKLYNTELTRKRPNKDAIQSNFQNGNPSCWDCTTLFDAILFSNAIGNNLKSSEKKAWDAIDDLRVARNTITHDKTVTLSDFDFQDLVSKIEKSFYILNFSISDIKEIRTDRNSFESFKVLPCKPNHFVVERPELRDQIVNDLTKLRNENNNMLTYYYISGNTGSGKSQLARQVFEKIFQLCDFKNEISFVWTLDGKDVNSLFKTFRDLSYRLNCDKRRLKSVLEESIALNEKVKSLRSLLSTRTKLWNNWWVVFDNVHQLSEILPLLPQLGDNEWMNGQILFTVQNTDAVTHDEILSKHISISHGMNDEECRELLSHYTKTENADANLLKEIMHALDRQPLALAAAGYYVSSTNKANYSFSWKQYLEKLYFEKYNESNNTLAKVNSAYPKTMFQAAVFAVQQNAQISTALANIIRLFSMISFDPLPRDLIVYHIQTIDPNQKMEDISLNLAHCSLFLYSENNDIRLHRVVHEAIYFYQFELVHKEEENEQFCNTICFQQTVSQVVQTLYKFKDRDDQLLLIPHLEKFLKLLHAQNVKIDINILQIFKYFVSTLRYFGKYNIALELLENLRTQIHTIDFYDTTWCLNELGLLHHKTGAYDKAKKLLKKCLEIQEESLKLGKNHVNVAASLNNLGLVYDSTGNYEKAKVLYEKALKIKKNELGPRHVFVATSLYNLGRIYQKTGHYNKAKELHEEALELRKELLGENHVDVAASLIDLGIIYDAHGDYDKAKELYEDAMEIKEKCLGSDHVDVASCFNNLGLIYENTGELDKAKEFHEKAVEILKKSLGPSHVDVASPLNNLGSVYKKTGENEKAKEYYEKALKIKQNSLGLNHVSVATTLYNLGQLYHKTGEYDKAIKFHEDALKIRQKVLSVHADVASSLNDLGLLYSTIGKYMKAKTLHENALKVRKTVFGPNHVDVAASLNNLGLVYKDTGELEKSKEFHEKSLEIHKKLLGPDHVNVAASLNNLGMVYEKTGENEKAKEYYEKALKIKQNSLGFNHVSVATSLFNLGRLYHKTGGYEKAIEFHEMSFDIRKKAFGPNHINLAGSLNSLGMVYDTIQDFEKAKELYEKALKIEKNCFGSNHVMVAASLFNLGKVYHKTGDYDKATDFHEHCLEIRKKLLGPNHIDVATSLNNLGIMHDKIGHYDKAKNFYEEALEIKNRCLGPHM